MAIYLIQGCLDGQLVVCGAIEAASKKAAIEIHSQMRTDAATLSSAKQTSIDWGRYRRFKRFTAYKCTPGSVRDGVVLNIGIRVGQLW